MSKRTLLILIIVLALGGIGIWLFYFQSPSTSSATEQGTPSTNPDVQRLEQQLVDLRRLRDLQIDTSILKNPFLQSLEAPRIPAQISGTTTPYSTSGRPNPFLPF